jgi:hypothetical protein
LRGRSNHLNLEDSDALLGHTRSTWHVGGKRNARWATVLVFTPGCSVSRASNMTLGVFITWGLSQSTIALYIRQSHLKQTLITKREMQVIM